MGAVGYGALRGMGEGLSRVGADMAAEDEYRRRQQIMEQRQLDVQGARLAATPARSGSLPLSDIVSLLKSDSLEPLLRSQGMSPEEAADEAARIRDGRSATTDQTSSSPLSYSGGDPYNPDAEVGSTQSTTKVQKYDAGQASALMEKSRVALRRALGLTDVAKSDDIAKAENTEAITRNAQAGTDAGRRGALLLAGKDPDLNDAKADEALDKGAAAMKKASQPPKAAGGGKGGGNTNETERKAIGAEINAANAMIKTIGAQLKVTFDDKVRDGLQAKLDQQQAIVSDGQARLKKFSERLSGTGGATAPTGRKPLSTFGR